MDIWQIWARIPVVIISILGNLVLCDFFIGLGQYRRPYIFWVVFLLAIKTQVLRKNNNNNNNNNNNEANKKAEIRGNAENFHSWTCDLPISLTPFFSIEIHIDLGDHIFVTKKSESRIKSGKYQRVIMTHYETRTDLRNHGYGYGYHIHNRIRTRKRAKPLYHGGSKCRNDLFS